MLPLKKVAVFKISNCWWGFLGTVMTSMLLLHLPDNLSRHWGMEIDCVVPQALSCLVTLTTAAFEWFADTNLCSVTILSMVLYAIHILWRRQKHRPLDAVTQCLSDGGRPQCGSDAILDVSWKAAVCPLGFCMNSSCDLFKQAVQTGSCPQQTQGDFTRTFVTPQVLTECYLTMYLRLTGCM